MKDQNKDCSLIILLGEVTSEKERNKGVKYYSDWFVVR